MYLTYRFQNQYLRFVYVLILDRKTTTYPGRRFFFKESIHLAIIIKKSEMTKKGKKKEKINVPPLSFYRHPEEKHIFSLGLSAYTVRAV